MNPLPLHLNNPDFQSLIEPLWLAGVLQAQDALLVDSVAPRYAEADAQVLLALALAVRAPRAGHVGANLAEAHLLTADFAAESPARAFAWPAQLPWQERVQASAIVGPPAGDQPFVAQSLGNQSSLLMTRRMWQAQARLAELLLTLANSEPALLLSEADIAAGIAKLGLSGETAAGVVVAARRRLAVITGGPGTGKTYSIKVLLPLLLERAARDGQVINVQLAAPTGKAAVRMQEGIAQDLEQLPTTPAVREAILSLVPQTLHKLLGLRPDGSALYHRDRPLDCDVLVVDEVSMVDLQLMLRLVDAVPPGARLILLGDRDQLASVEAGTVLADLLAGAMPRGELSNPLGLCVARYTRSRRFDSAPTIADIAAALQHGGEPERLQALGLLCLDQRVARDPEPGRLRWLDRELDAPQDSANTKQGSMPSGALSLLAEPYQRCYVSALDQALAATGRGDRRWRDVDLQLELLQAFDQYRILAVHRKGPRGVAGLEQALSKVLRDELSRRWNAQLEMGLVQGGELPVDQGHWLGRPVLVTENSYEVGLMNGDIGLVLPTGEKRRMHAVFRDTRPGMPPVRAVPLARLPPHQGALVLTVHKSQGSQFPSVALVLADRASPIQTRELIYTGLTRAQQRFAWLGRREVLDEALKTRVQRASGLAELLQP